MNLEKTEFAECEINEVDFTETNLNSAIFSKCNLEGTIFENTNLEKTDFRSSFNFNIDPELNRIKKTMFSQMELIGLLRKFDLTIE